MKKIEQYDLITDNQTRLQKIKVVLVDDQVFVRSFLKNILADDPTFQVVGTADNGKDAIEKVEFLHPDVILIDLEMPEMDGVTATEIIAIEYPKCKVLVLSSYEDREHLKKAFHAGAKGYILKSSSPQEILNAIHSVSQGHSQLSPGLLEKVLTPKADILPEAKRENNKKHSFSNEVRYFENFKNKILTFAKQNNVSSKEIKYSLLATTALLIPIAMFAKVDRTIAVPGKLEAKEELITLEASAAGKVVELEVKEGSKISRGQSLIKLEAPIVNSRLKQQKKQLAEQKKQLANLNILKKQQQLALIAKQQEGKTQELEQQSSLEQLQSKLDNLKANYSNQLAEQYTQLERAKKAISDAKYENKLAQIRYEAAQEKIEQYEKAYQKNAIGKELLLETKQTVKESKTNLEQTTFDISNATAVYQEKQENYNQKQQQLSEAIKQAALRVQEQQNSYRSLIQTNDTATFNSQEIVNDTEYQIVTLQSDIAKNNSLIEELKLKLEQRTLFAPIDGVVLKLLATEVGEIIKPGEKVAEIIPQEFSLVLKAKINIPENKRDLLEVGLPVKLKFDNYPARHYGFVSGRLTGFSHDLAANPNPYQTVSNSNEEANFYEIQIDLDRNYVQLKDEQILLTPGQSATAEVILGKQSLINSLF